MSRKAASHAVCRRARRETGFATSQTMQSCVVGHRCRPARVAVGGVSSSEMGICVPSRPKLCGGTTGVSSTVVDGPDVGSVTVWETKLRRTKEKKNAGAPERVSNQRRNKNVESQSSRDKFSKIAGMNARIVLS